MRFVMVLAPLTVGYVTASSLGDELSLSVVKRVLDWKDKSGFAGNGKISFPDEKQTKGFGFSRNLRSKVCDQVLATDCKSGSECMTCIRELKDNNVNWATVNRNDLSCNNVVDHLFNAGYCTSLRGNDVKIGQFCNVLNVCLPQNAQDQETLEEDTIDCSSLTSCDFDGFRASYIGDGICHDSLPGCYNTEVCGYDGGDCCPDTCNSKSSYKECGTDGYACRDPQSNECDPSFTLGCPRSPDKPRPKCDFETAPYKLVMHDSFGDGWDDTKLIIYNREVPGEYLFNGGLEDGFSGYKYLCFSATPSCYHVEVQGGVWGKEVSWEIKTLREGAPAVAGGGAPMSCQFPVGGDKCERSCNGHASKKHIDDPDYRDFKHMYECIKEKCIIQVGTCMADATCMPCLTQDTPEYCFNNDNFSAVITCGLCQCRDDMQDTEYCDAKASNNPGSEGEIPDERGGGRECTPQQTIRGTNAVVDFSSCADFEQLSSMTTDFDQNNFGMLDVFETCAHSYKHDPLHGGYHALGCMKILADAIDNPSSGNKDSPLDAIATLAFLLYHESDNFCDCAKVASDDCPPCHSFLNFKTLLYESLDACTALDEITCAAWEEFVPPCRKKLLQRFEVIDFGQPAQCSYVYESCGGAGTFPGSRTLDCDSSEISKSSRDFFVQFSQSCFGHTSGSPDTLPVKPAIPSKPIIVDVTPSPTEVYVPIDADEVTQNQREGKSSFWLWSVVLLLAILVAAGFTIYRKRRDSFTYVRYRRAPHSPGNELEYRVPSSGVFEPPTVPLTQVSLQQQNEELP